MSDPFETLTGWGLGLFMLGFGLFVASAAVCGSLWILLYTASALL